MSPQNILLRGGGGAHVSNKNIPPAHQQKQPSPRNSKAERKIIFVFSHELENCPNPGPFLEILAEHVEGVSV
jgi:hypothetical protein